MVIKELVKKIFSKIVNAIYEDDLLDYAVEENIALVDLVEEYYPKIIKLARKIAKNKPHLLDSLTFEKTMDYLRRKHPEVYLRIKEKGYEDWVRDQIILFKKRILYD